MNSTRQPEHAGRQRKINVGKVGFPSRHRWFPRMSMFASQKVASAMNTPRLEGSLPTSNKHPNAMPASERCPGQPGTLFKDISLTTSGSLSVIDATIPAMSRMRLCNFDQTGIRNCFHRSTSHRHQVRIQLGCAREKRSQNEAKVRGCMGL